MRVAICDYSGHPFQIQLSRELARRGHEILHASSGSFQTPKGALTKTSDDPDTLSIDTLYLDGDFKKHTYLRRWLQERSIGFQFAARLEQFRPDVLIASNFPLDALFIVARWAGKSKVPFVFWQQDIYSSAIRKILGRKLWLLGLAIGTWYKTVERSALSRSAAVVVISDDFRECLVQDFAVPSEKISVIQNWAPLDEITPKPKVNDWSRKLGLHESNVVLYTGTLGHKHSPEIILSLAESLRSRSDTKIVITSEGPVADWLKTQASLRDLNNVLVVGFQPYDRYPDVLGCAEVVVAMLEQEAGSFSVPSKVLSYLSAGKAIVISAPLENLASKTLVQNQCGAVTEPSDVKGFSAAVLDFLDNSRMRDQVSRAARTFAERTFDIRHIGDKFEAIIEGVDGKLSPQHGKAGLRDPRVKYDAA